jgi:hypothetical protein
VSTLLARGRNEILYSLGSATTRLSSRKLDACQGLGLTRSPATERGWHFRFDLQNEISKGATVSVKPSDPYTLAPQPSSRYHHPVLQS